VEEVEPVFETAGARARDRVPRDGSRGHRVRRHAGRDRIENRAADGQVERVVAESRPAQPIDQVVRREDEPAPRHDARRDLCLRTHDLHVGVARRVEPEQAAGDRRLRALPHERRRVGQRASVPVQGALHVRAGTRIDDVGRHLHVEPVGVPVPAAGGP
jgi:hypothetical protein